MARTPAPAQCRLNSGHHATTLSAAPPRRLAAAPRPPSRRSNAVTAPGLDSLKTRRRLTVGGRAYDYFSLKAAEKAGLGDLSRLPYSLKVLLENLLRHEDGRSVTVADIKALARWLKRRKIDREIAYRPARVLMQDFTGVPGGCRSCGHAQRHVESAGKPTPALINPLSPVDLVIDHSVMVDRLRQRCAHSTKTWLARNTSAIGSAMPVPALGRQTAFDNFRVVPPGTGICHQVNLEYLAQNGVDEDRRSGRARLAYPDTLVGTDSHTTMVNGLGGSRLGRRRHRSRSGHARPADLHAGAGSGGFRSSPARCRATVSPRPTSYLTRGGDAAQAHGVVGKFVEFHGDGLDHLALADRATIANMAPEYGATCGFFPRRRGDGPPISRLSGRPAESRSPWSRPMPRRKGMWRDASVTPDPVYSSDTLEASTSPPSEPSARRAEAATGSGSDIARPEPRL